jgi:hypothetical protein
MRSRTCLGLLCGALLLGSSVSADVTDTTPYDYDRPPKAGKEEGTYVFSTTGAAGPDCVYTCIGTIKLLPNAEGTGGNLCGKCNVDLRGSGLVCLAAPLVENTLAVLGGPYTYNGDGTLCENTKFIGGLLNDIAITFHTYVDPKGKWLNSSNQDIAYACPGIVPNGVVIGSAVSFKIGKHGDDPPGSGVLPCTNP